MVEASDNEISIRQVVYAFASVGDAKGGEACLSTATLAICKESWRPTGICSAPRDAFLRGRRHGCSIHGAVCKDGEQGIFQEAAE